MAGATPDRLDAAETAIGRPLPPELRVLLAADDGHEARYGEVFVSFYDTVTLVDVNVEIEDLSGFLAFASDGGRELIGLDTRRAPPPVVMLDITAAGWSDGLYQAPSLEAFLEQLHSDAPLRWDVPYRPDDPA